MPKFGYCTVSLAWQYASPDKIGEAVRRMAAESPNDVLELDADPGPRDLAWVVALAADPCVQPDG